MFGKQEHVVKSSGMTMVWICLDILYIYISYIHIYTDIHKYTQIYTDIHRYTQIYTDIHSIDIYIYMFINMPICVIFLNPWIPDYIFVEGFH